MNVSPDDKLRGLAATPVLLVASDYDGTLAPIVDDPNKTAPLRESLGALRDLARLSSTHVAIISGRALKTLSELVGSPDHLHLVGSHGSEFGPGFAASLPRDAIALLGKTADELARIGERAPGFLIERKPASVAFHYRNAADLDAQAALRQIVAGPASWPGVITHHGKRVIELSVVQASKGAALTMLRHRLGATGVIFLGDDLTDENAFAVLSGADVGVKVGPGETRAAFRVSDVEEVSRVLARLCALRAGAYAPAPTGAA